jgi:hypothetical protein
MESLREAGRACLKDLLSDGAVICRGYGCIMTPLNPCMGVLPLPIWETPLPVASRAPVAGKAGRGTRFLYG